jgi:hypothetical protein
MRAPVLPGTVFERLPSRRERRHIRVARGAAQFCRRLLAPDAARAGALAATVLGMLLAVGLGHWLNPADPLGVAARYPWIWLPAAFFALRYGALPGMLAGLCIAAAWGLFYPHPDEVQAPLGWLTGGLLQVLLAGHCRDLWSRRVDGLASVNDYLDERVQALARSHYLLGVSHERLEQDLLSRPATLRAALLRLRELLPLQAQAVRAATLPQAQSLLEFAAATCQLDAAAIFSLTPYGFGRKAVATVGEAFELDLADPLVRDCLERGALTHVREVDGGVHSAYLACAPIAAHHGVAGVLIVRRMPFLALNFDNLQLLLVLLGYYADSIEQSAAIAAVQRSVPHCPYDFALELVRLCRLKARSGIDSSLLALVVPRDAQGDSLCDALVREQRVSDLIWTQRARQRQVVLLLMPLAGRSGVDGYLLRIESLLRSRFDCDFSGARVAVHSLQLDPSLGGAAGGECGAQAGHGTGHGAAANDARAAGAALRIVLERCGQHD